MRPESTWLGSWGGFGKEAGAAAATPEVGCAGAPPAAVDSDIPGSAGGVHAPP